MKVILTNHTVFPFHCHYGGVEKRVFNLGKYLLRMGIDVRIISSLPTSKVKSARYEEIKYEFILPEFWKLARSNTVHGMFFLAQYSVNLSRYLQKQDFDVLHAHLTDPYFYLRKGRSKPTVFQPFEEIYAGLDLAAQTEKATGKRGNAITCALINHVNRLCMKNASAIASENETQSSLLARLFKIEQDRIFVLPVGVDIEYVDVVLERDCCQRSDLGLAEQDFVLISINRFEPMKGLEYLIEALAILKKRISHVKLILIGSGSVEPLLKQKIMEMELEQNVIHLRSVDEGLLYQYLRISDVYISPTLHDVSVQSVIEAMACKLPIISTGQSFWVKNGINGFVVPKKSANDLAQATLRLYDTGNLRIFGKRSREISEQYSYTIISKLAVAKYEELVTRI